MVCYTGEALGLAKWQLAYRLIGVGWFIGISILLGILGGSWLDGKLGTGPVFLIAGLLLGVVAAFYGLYRMVAPLMNSRRNGGKG